MTAPVTGEHDRGQRARQLYEDGLSLRQVAERLGVAHTTVRRELQTAGVPLRRRHLRVVPGLPPRPPATLTVAPERSAIAYSADRGWHMVQAPPRWFLELLSDLA